MCQFPTMRAVTMISGAASSGDWKTELTDQRVGSRSILRSQLNQTYPSVLSFLEPHVFLNSITLPRQEKGVSQLEEELRTNRFKGGENQRQILFIVSDVYDDNNILFSWFNGHLHIVAVTQEVERVVH